MIIKSNSMSMRIKFSTRQNKIGKFREICVNLREIKISIIRGCDKISEWNLTLVQSSYHHYLNETFPIIDTFISILYDLKNYFLNM